jgi:hypothetical protein
LTEQVSDDKKEITSIVNERLWSDDAADVEAAMDSLHKLVWIHNKDRVQNRYIAFRCGAHLALVKAMNRHANSLKSQQTGMQCLGCISSRKGSVQGIVEVSAIPCCINAMDRYATNPGIQATGCNLIGNLWWYQEVRETAGEEGGLTAVLAAMNNHKQEAAVQDQGCQALRRLIRVGSSTFGVKSTVDAGGIQAVVAAMENHPKHTRIQLVGCQFLATLATRDEDDGDDAGGGGGGGGGDDDNEDDDGDGDVTDYRQCIIAANGLVTVAQARQVHHDNNEVLREADKAIKATIP